MTESLTPERIEQTSAWLGVFRDSRLPGMVFVSSQSLAEAADVVDALATAAARARREALEEAALPQKIRDLHAAQTKACDAFHSGTGEWIDVLNAGIRKDAAISEWVDGLLAATPPEDRQTEMGWKPPAGWKLVPERPTDEMVSAAWMKTGDRARYCAMIAAAPPAPPIGNLDGEGRS